MGSVGILGFVKVFSEMKREIFSLFRGHFACDYFFNKFKIAKVPLTFSLPSIYVLWSDEIFGISVNTFDSILREVKNQFKKKY